MKKINLYAMALSAFMISLSSCSSDDVDTSENIDPVPYEEASTASAFLALNIQMANSASTRADEEVVDPTTYNVGTEEEYKISKAKLLIWEGDADYPDESKYVKYYDLGTGNLNTTTPVVAEISNYGSVVTDLTGLTVDKTKHYYALVLVNKFPTDKLPTAGDSFADWKAKTITLSDNPMVDALTSTSNGSSTTDYSNFFMSNALRYIAETTTGSGDTQVTTPAHLESLVDVTSHLMDTREKAYADGAGTDPCYIYVERGLAKVSMTEYTDKKYWSTGEYFPTGSPYTGSVKFTKWTTDNMNTSEYPVHLLGYDGKSVDTSTDPATVTYVNPWGITAYSKSVKTNVGTTAEPDERYSLAGNELENVYASIFNTYKHHFVGTNDRVFWAYTPRYFYDTTTKGSGTAKEAVDTSDNTDFKNGVDGYVYIPENCQHYDNMRKATDTRVVMKAVYNPTASGASADKGDKVYSDGESFFMIGTTPWKVADVLAEINTALGLSGSNVITTEQAANYFDLDELNKAGIFTEDCIKDGNLASSSLKQNLSTINSAFDLNAKYKPISYYKSGVCYYTAYIRHITDSHVDWETGTYKLNHLGRYGIVRNNWYDLQIQTVEKPGKPYIPEVPDPKDPEQTDDEELYVRVNIRLLAWVKHSTTVSDLE